MPEYIYINVCNTSFPAFQALAHIKALPLHKMTATAAGSWPPPRWTNSKESCFHTACEPQSSNSHSKTQIM